MKQKKLLPKPAKEAATHALTDLGFSVRMIAKIMGVDKNTILRYQKSELADEYIQFSDSIKKIYLEQDFELTQMVVKHIKERMPKARFYELAGFFKIVRELQQPKVPFVAQQFVGTDMKVGFTNDDGEAF